MKSKAKKHHKSSSTAMTRHSSSKSRGMTRAKSGGGGRLSSGKKSPLLPFLLIGGVGVGLWALLSPKKASAAPALPPTPGADKATSELPPDLRAEAAALLATGQDPVKMEQVAAELDKDGFHDTAALLRKRAADLRAAQAAALPGVPSAPGGAAALPSPQTIVSAARRFVVAPSGLKVRSGPSTSTPEVAAVIPFGTQVNVTSDRPDGWTQISSPAAGFVCNTCPQAPGGPWLSPTAPGGVAVVPSPSTPSGTAVIPVGFTTTRFVIAPSGLNVRSLATPNSTLLRTLPPGTPVQVVQEGPNGWTQISSPVAGFVCNTCPAAPGGPWLSPTLAAPAAAPPLGLPTLAPPFVPGTETAVPGIPGLFLPAGFIPASTTTPSLAIPANPNAPANMAKVAAPSGVKLRTGPGVAFPQVTTQPLLPLGTNVQVKAVLPTGWTQVTTQQGSSGFVCSTCPEAPGGPWLTPVTAQSAGISVSGCDCNPGS
jgi:uncharacterized protein YgiM (DUF1202 family)